MFIRPGKIGNPERTSLLREYLEQTADMVLLVVVVADRVGSRKLAIVYEDGTGSPHTIGDKCSHRESVLHKCSRIFCCIRFKPRDITGCRGRCCGGQVWPARLVFLRLLKRARPHGRTPARCLGLDEPQLRRVTAVEPHRRGWRSSSCLLSPPWDLSGMRFAAHIALPPSPFPSPSPFLVSLSNVAAATPTPCPLVHSVSPEMSQRPRPLPRGHWCMLDLSATR